ncbi:ABC transporter ATP-binding protein [Streptomyces thermolilacinus]|uniref:ABC transporter ATP-binding protein n=1 Tax=Streptomyces thermolilacinus TaxID=285540 RepID=UPI0033E7D13C
MIRFEHVTKRYADGRAAVDDLSFEVARGELVTLVGPSGCGKTTTMKMVNRLVEPTSGRVLVDGRDVTTADPVELRRGIGYVIQQVGLFPHRTVLENTATVPRLLGTGRARAHARAAELLDLVGLDPRVFGDRYPDQLSGGQRQRVGVARALAADPPVLLMDEPFGAVDPVVRERLQTEFLKLQARMRKTVLFVTHDLEEAVRLGDRMAVYGHGRIEQLDPPAAVLGAPTTPYVADFVGGDRALRRLSVTPVEEAHLDRPPVVRLGDPLPRAWDGARAVVLDADGRPYGWLPAADETDGGPGAVRKEPRKPGGVREPGCVRELARPMEARVQLGGSLKEAFSAMLRYDAGWVAVVDPADGGRYLGVLTPERLHEALRRSVGAGSGGDGHGSGAVDNGGETDGSRPGGGVTPR